MMRKRVSRKDTWPAPVWVGWLIATVIVFVFLVRAATAADLTVFLTEPNTESDLAGYRLYMSDTPDTWPEEPVCQIPAGIDACMVRDVEPGTYYFSMTAVDESGNESTKCDPATAEIKPLDSTAPGTPHQPTSKTIGVFQFLY